MEKREHKYILEGLEIVVPLKKRRGEGGYIEDCTELINHPRSTPLGHPVVLTSYEPCELFAEELDDCSDCRYFKGAETENFTLIGVCTHEERRKKI